MTDRPKDMTPQQEEQLVLDVARIWREERVSCPHPDMLASWLAGGVTGGAAEFMAFHLDESECPYCNAVVADLRAAEDADEEGKQMESMRSRLLRSTATALRESRPDLG